MEKISMRKIITLGLVLVLVLAAAVAAAVAGCSGSSSSTTTTGVGSSDLKPPKDWTTGSTAPSTTATTIKSGTKTTGTTIITNGKTQADYEKELPGLAEMAKANPKDLAALQQLAIAQFNLGHFADAASTYQKMLAIQNDATTRNNYANVLRDWKKTAEAKKEYQQAISLDPTLTTAYVNLAVMWVAEKNLTEANKVLDQGIAKTTGEEQTRLKNYKVQINKKQ